MSRGLAFRRAAAERAKLRTARWYASHIDAESVDNLAENDVVVRTHERNYALVCQWAKSHRGAWSDLKAVKGNHADVQRMSELRGRITEREWADYVGSDQADWDDFCDCHPYFDAWHDAYGEWDEGECYPWDYDDDDDWWCFEHDTATVRMFQRRSFSEWPLCHWWVSGQTSTQALHECLTDPESLRRERDEYLENLIERYRPCDTAA